MENNVDFNSIFAQMGTEGKTAMKWFMAGLTIGMDRAKNGEIKKDREPKGFDIELWKDPKYYPHYCNQEEKPNDRNNENQERA